MRQIHFIGDSHCRIFLKMKNYVKQKYNLVFKIIQHCIELLEME